MPAHILCVEDEPELLDDLALELQDHGYAVSKVADGALGLDRLTSERFDLVICDMRLPGMDGLQMMLEATARSPAYIPPFVLLTAFVDQDLRQRALASGAVDFIVKPVDYVYLLERLAELLGA